MSILFNAQLTSNINELQQIPLPILKYTVTCSLYTYDKLINSILNKADSLQEKQIDKILINQQIQAPYWRKGVNSLKYLIKQCKKKDISAKGFGLFLSENTMLSKQFAQYAAQKYQEILSLNFGVPNTAVVLDTNWGIFNLKQSKQGHIINKLYIKHQIETSENGCKNNLVFTTMFPEHRLLQGQLAQISTKMH